MNRALVADLDAIDIALQVTDRTTAIHHAAWAALARLRTALTAAPVPDDSCPHCGAEGTPLLGAACEGGYP